MTVCVGVFVGVIEEVTVCEGVILIVGVFEGVTVGVDVCVIVGVTEGTTQLTGTLLNCPVLGLIV